MFFFNENFKRFDKNYLPYGIFVERCSDFWHNHGLKTENGYSIACSGNKYLFKTPLLLESKTELSFKFGVLNNYAGVSVFLGYNPDGHKGYEILLEWNKDSSEFLVNLISIQSEKKSLLKAERFSNCTFPESGKEYSVTITNDGKNITVSTYTGSEISFEVNTRKGYVGFSRPNFVGEVVFTDAKIWANVKKHPVIDPFTVEIPLVNGGTIPLTARYELFDCGEQRYLSFTLGGGPQERETHKTYPCNTKGQYCVERWFMDTPYLTYNGVRYNIVEGWFNLCDPTIAWAEILIPMLNFTMLPITITVPVSGDPVELGFGYDNLKVSGFAVQEGGSEFNYSANGKYLGERIFKDTFLLQSPKDKQAVKMIPLSVYDYQTVKDHFIKNHYFAEDEDISFTVFAKTDKKYISYKAELLNVYFERLEDLTVKDGIIKHKPLPVGVYRVLLSVFYGDTILKTVDTVFEVFDKTGKKCAPIESGLPVQFSMPNEQQYLDRDPFDPWNNGKASNSEHYYSVTAFTGHVAEHKRTYEVTKLFGREWYVWLSDHRSMVDSDYKDHMDIVKNADYVYYKSDYEWAVLRSDYNLDWFWTMMPKTRELLYKFLNERDGARERVGLNADGVVTNDVITNLYKYYFFEWRAYLQKAVKEMFIAQNELFKSINPNFKRACYGPFNVYASTMRTSKQCEMHGFKPNDELSDIIYTGFAQFEDYPASCAYQTYRGAFGVGATLVSSPKLKIYPEQYKSSIGGCIDGAVYFANPPIGAYKMPLWFNTTHSREYVYNTARKTADGWAFWSSYGFMKADFNDEENDAFVRDWKYVLKHKPKKPLKNTTYISVFPDTDDTFETDFPRWRAEHNISEEGVGYLYETSRLSGLLHGTFADWETLNTITEADTDMLILPSTEGLNKKTLDKIRELYAKGVALFAVSKVDGLEDLFGVKPHPVSKCFDNLSINDQYEPIYPYTDKANYTFDGAECVLYASDVPAIFTYNKTALLNIPCCSLGRQYFFAKDDNGRTTVSKLMRSVCSELLRKLSSPIASSSDAGITLFTDENQDDILLAIDYSVHDQSKIDDYVESVITLNVKDYEDAYSIDQKPIRKFINADGVLEGIAVSLRQHESALIKLKKRLDF